MSEDIMPLPHFLVMIAAVILAAALTIWATLSAGVPVAALALVALTGAAVLHLSMRDNEG
ncbi:MAG: hypothetical protein ACK5IP_05770 [Paracoccus sp. (in: a-proteobacteria)]